jgi:hypothetical protein
MNAVAHDHQLRVLLKEHLRRRIVQGDRLVDEFQLAYGTARADLALINGHLEGFEIKAGRDSLVRLPGQIEAYDKVFEYSWVVTTEGHLAQVRSLVPQGWGLLVARQRAGSFELKVVRAAKRNVGRDAAHLARLLWRDELLAKLGELGLSRGASRKPKVALFGALAAAMSVDTLADYVRRCLKTRADWRADAAPRECGDWSHPDATASHCRVHQSGW